MFKAVCRKYLISELAALIVDLYRNCGLRILAGFIPVGSGYWQGSYLCHKVEMYSFIDNATFRSSHEIFAE